MPVFTHGDVNTAITRLRISSRGAIGREAYAYAKRLLPTSAKYGTPADLAALWIITIGLYHAALTRDASRCGADCVAAFVDARYHDLRSGAAQEIVFDAGANYPEELQNYLRALSQLPLCLVLAGIEHARNVLLTTTNCDSSIKS